MKKFVVPLMLVACFLMAAGCSTTNKISLGGEAELFHVTSWDLFAPNTVAFYQIDKETGYVIMVNGGVGASSLGTIAGPAAVAYAGNQLKKGLRDSGDEVNSEINNTSESEGGAAGATGGAGGYGYGEGGTAFGGTGIGGAGGAGGAGGDAVSGSISEGGKAISGSVSGAAAGAISNSASSVKPAAVKPTVAKPIPVKKPTVVKPPQQRQNVNANNKLSQ
jgi:hypothetical protein